MKVMGTVRIWKFHGILTPVIHGFSYLVRDRDRNKKSKKGIEVCYDFYLVLISEIRVTQ